MEKPEISIIHLITTLDAGGAEAMLYKTLSRMNRKKFHPVVVGMTDMGGIGGKIEALGIKVETLGMRLGRPTIRGVWRLYRILKETRPAILQTYMYHANLLGLLVGRMAGVSRIVWSLRCSEMDFKRYRALTRWVVRWGAWLSPGVDLLLSNSHAGIRHHQQMGYRNSSLRVISNGFDLEQFTPDKNVYAEFRRVLGLNTRDILIGLVARWDPMKDHETFIRAASIVAKELPHVYFILAGSNIEKGNPELMRMIKENRLDGRVFLLGLVDDVRRVNMALDIACSSSLGEGFSNAIGEAMACGVPCVVTDVGDSAWLVGETGRVVSPRDSEGIATALLELVHNPELRNYLGNEARKRIQTHFNIDEVVVELEKTYENLLSS